VNEAKRKAEGIQRTLSIQTKLDDRKIGVLLYPGYSAAVAEP
jgi:hypothetical protein